MCLIKGRLENKDYTIAYSNQRNFYRFIYSDTATIITGTKKLGFGKQVPD
jgi:hypothetical protein